MKVTAMLLVVLTAGAAVTAAQNPATAAAAIKSHRALSLFLSKLNMYTDILEELQDPMFSGTVFAPSNAAIRAAEAAGVVLSSDILRYHIVPGPPGPVTMLNDDQIFTSSQGETLQAQYVDGKLTINGKGSSAQITDADTMVGPAEYAVVHVINNVLLPYAPAKPLLPVGSSATGTVGAASTGTVTNPTNTASGASSGSGTTTTTGTPTGTASGTVTATDLAPEAAPPAASPAPAESPEATPETLPVIAPAEPPAQPPAQDSEPEVSPEVTEEEEGEGEVEWVMDVAIDANLTALAKAIDIAGLADYFGPEFNGTVFAPTDEALLAFISKAGLDLSNLSKEGLVGLQSILAYHVVANEALFAADLEDGMVLRTLNGAPLTIALKDGKVFVQTTSGQEVEVVIADVEAGPAVVHVIGEVLVPAAGAPPPAEAPASSASSTAASLAALAGASLAAAVLLL